MELSAVLRLDGDFMILINAAFFSFSFCIPTIQLCNSLSCDYAISRDQPHGTQALHV